MFGKRKRGSRETVDTEGEAIAIVGDDAASPGDRKSVV